MITCSLTDNTIKTKLIELEMMKQSYIKKLNKLETQIAELRKGDK